MSDSLQPHGLQHARLLCTSPTPGACSNSCPSRRWCHPTISSSVIPFSSCFQSLPASESFPMSQCSTSGGQSIGSFSFSVRPSSEYSGFISCRIDWFDLLAVQGTVQSLLTSAKNIQNPSWDAANITKGKAIENYFGVCCFICLFWFGGVVFCLYVSSLSFLPE